MKSVRPYLIRALHEWIIDNGQTPYLTVKADFPGVEVPDSTIANGQVVLNIAGQAVQGLEIGDEYIGFAARFSGMSHSILIPVAAVLAINAKENGQGMAFPVDETVPEEPTPEEPVTESEGRGGATGRASHLRVVE